MGVRFPSGLPDFPELNSDKNSVIFQHLIPFKYYTAPSSNWFRTRAFQVRNAGSSPAGAAKIKMKNIQRSWDLYLHTQKYSECQLVSAINAYTYLTGKTIDQNSKRYEDLVDLCKARHGSAICIEKVHEKLGIGILGLHSSIRACVGFHDIPKDRPTLPCELSVWHKGYGFHSVAVVEHEPRTQSVRIPNFDKLTNSRGWVFIEDLQHYEKMCGGYVCRSFRLLK